MGRLGSTWLASALLCASVATAADADPVAAAISAELDALMNPEVTTLQGATIAFGDSLREFYSRREFRASWSSAAPRQQLLKALADSYGDGLDPEDYHLTLLRKLATQVTAPDATDTLKAQYDILLTEALVRLGYHLSFGKVDPETFDAQWNYGRTLPRTDVPREIEDAIASATVYDRVAALKPTHRLYTRLKQELLRLRDIEKKDGWGQLPAGPALKPGDRDERVRSLRARLVRGGDLPDSAVGEPLVYDAPLVAAVKRYQQRHGLEADGVVGEGTVAELNVPVAERIAQLRVNLDRGRVLLHDLPDRFIVVNIAGYTLYLVQGQEIAWNTRVQVGKTYRRTPLFRSEISYLVFNPTWTVPPGIIKADILPAARKDPHAITRKGLKVLDGNGREIDPTSVDWSRFKQRPHSVHAAPGSRAVKCARPGQAHVPQSLSRVPARHTFAIALRTSRSRVQFRLCARRTRARALGTGAERCGTLEQGFDLSSD